MIKNVWFDLDGTLLPMELKVFQKSYLGSIAKTLAPFGYDPQAVIAGVMHGVDCMAKNDGTMTNEERFWEGFAEALGPDVREKTEAPLDAYYLQRFDNERNSCGFDPQSAQVVRLLKAQGYRVVLATNPMFPRIATEKRVRWVGLEPEDFEVCTAYEDWHYCKPNPKYYAEICERFGMEPTECLMVGNDVQEDMVAEKIGMKTFLLTACLINRNDADYSRYPQGDFTDLLRFIEKCQ